MRRALIFSWLAVLLLAGLSGEAGAQTQKGRLQVYRKGEPVGSEQYEINATTTELQARGEVTLRIGEQQVRQTVDLLLNADLSPRRYEWKLKEPEERWLRVEFQGSQGTIAFPREDGQKEEQIYNFGSERLVVLDVNVFHHFLLLARFYDFKQGGSQTIPVFIPQAVQPGIVTVELEGVDTMPVEGEEQPVRRLSIATEDNSLVLWVTESGRFVRLQVPGADVEVVPEGADR
jgi:hypothetical protein